MAPKIFLWVWFQDTGTFMLYSAELTWHRTGGTGYIGGSVLDAIVRQHPEYDVTVLLRNIPAKFSEKYPNVKIVQGTFDDIELLSDTAAENDIVIR